MLLLAYQLIDIHNQINQLVAGLSAIALMNKQWAQILLMLALSLFGAVTLHQTQQTNRAELYRESPSAVTEPAVTEQSVTEIPLLGPLAKNNSEVSGLAWHEDFLILLPQYPERLGNNLFALPKAEIMAFVEGQSQEPLQPQPIELKGIEEIYQIEGFEGFEAIAFSNNQAFITIEAKTNPSAKGYLIAGTLSNDLSELVITPNTQAEILPQSASKNKSEEAIFTTAEQIISIYEVNGQQLNPQPVAHTFNFELEPQPTIPFPTIDYRLTDATALDDNNHFWAINYFYPGDDDLFVQPEPLANQYGQGQSHAEQAAVERLVKFAYTPNGITRVQQAPIQLVLGPEGRNWEGIARLGDRGFLLITDKHPQTILGFVEKPNGL